MDTVLKIEGMKCVHCRKRVEDALSAVPGVEAVTVDLENKTARVTGSAEEKLLARAVIAAGFDIAD